jgi:hypothetical protein
MPIVNAELLTAVAIMATLLAMAFGGTYVAIQRTSNKPWFGAAGVVMMMVNLAATVWLAFLLDR